MRNRHLHIQRTSGAEDWRDHMAEISRLLMVAFGADILFYLGQGPDASFALLGAIKAIGILIGWQLYRGFRHKPALVFTRPAEPMVNAEEYKEAA